MAKRTISLLSTLAIASMVWANVSLAAPSDDRDSRVRNSERSSRAEQRDASRHTSSGRQTNSRPTNSQSSSGKKDDAYSVPRNVTKIERNTQRVEQPAVSNQTERQRVVQSRETISTNNDNRRQAGTRTESRTENRTQLQDGNRVAQEPQVRREYNHADTNRDVDRRNYTVEDRDRRDRDSNRNDSDRRDRDSNHHNDRDRRDDDHRHADYSDRSHRDHTRVVVNQYYYRPGHRIERLPTGIRRLYYQPYPLYFFGGTYYRPSSSGFIVVRAPIGVRVRTLPIGYVSLTFGSSVYYYVNDVYYRPYGTEYIVVDAPAETYTVPVASTYGSGDWAIYPRYGQSDEELQQDRYECHLWANERTGFDPSMPYQDQDLRDDYYRAQAACLEGRGYTIK